MKHIKLSYLAAALIAASPAFASSHREAPFITKNPKVDATDFYMFRSYQTGRAGYVTIIADYLPLQDPYGGPNYFTLDPEALYEIHVDNTGDSVEDLTFQFRFQNPLSNNGQGIRLMIAAADGGSPQQVAIPLRIAGQVNLADGGEQLGNINNPETYTVNLVRGNRRTGTSAAVTNVAGAGMTFTKPIDNIGTKTFAGGYANYANKYIYDINIPGCAGAPTTGRMFVGQRREPFAVNLGPIFDLINAPLAALTTGPRNAAPNPLADKNITTLALEIPTNCLQGPAGPNQNIIGGWTTASLRQARVLNPNARYDQPAREGGAWTQVSRLSNPLVNEVVIGLPDKDKFNSSEPKDDGANFATYVTNPTLPKLIEIIFGAANAPAPTAIPRTDLVAAFLTGVTAIQGNVNTNGATSEMIRLNMGVAATPRAMQSDFGAASCLTTPTATAGAQVDLSLAACDPAGFPNGRRPGDDTVDIALRVMMGRLLNTTVAPAATAPLHDAVLQTASQFDDVFPYLRTPISGSP